MNRRQVIALTGGAMLLGGRFAFAEAEEASKPAMHMMDHRSDQEIATEYRSEAAQLREKAESHRTLAKLYRSRRPPKGTANYESVAKHCDKLAQFYDDAAREAEGVAVELTK